MELEDIKEILKICADASSKILNWFGSEADDELFEEAYALVSDYFGRN